MLTKISKFSLTRNLLLSIGHYGNYSCCYQLYADKRVAGSATIKDPWHASWGTLYGLTGQLLVIIMVLIYASSTASYRRSANFTVFWYTHMFFIPFYVLMLLHGKNFWLWFLPVGFLYVAERVLKNLRSATHSRLKRVQILPGKVVVLELEKPNFEYLAGQYAFINCPEISRSEWHPFTISSSPEDELLSFHIKVCKQTIVVS